MKISKLGILLLVFIINTGCDLFKDEHKLRIANNYPATVNTAIGDVQYAPIAYNTTSEYKSIGEGSHELSGDLHGTVTISGSGYHRWTLILNADGTFSIRKD